MKNSLPRDNSAVGWMKHAAFPVFRPQPLTLWAIKGNNISCQNTAAQPFAFWEKCSVTADSALGCAAPSINICLLLTRIVGFLEPIGQGNNVVLLTDEWSSRKSLDRGLKFKTVCCFEKKKRSILSGGI